MTFPDFDPSVWRFGCPFQAAIEGYHRLASERIADSYRACPHMRSVEEQAKNLTSDDKEVLSEVKLTEINAATLQEEFQASESSSWNFLPMLGEDGFFVKGWSHIIAGYPKVGKTELIVRAVSEWQGERVLYFTEEPMSLWKARLDVLPKCYERDHVELCFAIGVDPLQILKRMKDGNESVVVIDTVRILIGIKDESDNSEVARTMIQYIAAAREKNKTLIFSHHERKAGGKDGRGITGGHAFLGTVDIAIELTKPRRNNRRELSGLGRVRPVPELVYELQNDGRMVALGSPDANKLDEVKERVLGALGKEWKTTREVRNDLDEPKPSIDQVTKALEGLAGEDKADRDPPISKGKGQGKTYKWRLPQSEEEEVD